MDMKRPLLFAHRGFSGEYPENSPLAFQMAVEKTCADGIESDVHISKDGKLVISHDASVADIPIHQPEKDTYFFSSGEQ